MKYALILAFSLVAINQAAAGETTYTFNKATGVSTLTTAQGTYTTRRTQSGGTTTYSTTYEKANRSFNERALTH